MSPPVVRVGGDIAFINRSRFGGDLLFCSQGYDRLGEIPSPADADTEVEAEV